MAGERPRVELLRLQMEEAYEPLRDRVEGLSEEEFFWEPVPGCWTLRLMPNERWDVDYSIPDPDPAPLTTIAWRLLHVATCKVMYHEYAFGPGRLTWDTIEYPHTVPTAMTLLARGQQLLMDDLAGLTDEGLDLEVMTNWGERWPAWRIFWTMIGHDVGHGGEIGCLRDLYRSDREISPPVWSRPPG
jgi:hypothetical protein